MCWLAHSLHYSLQLWYDLKRFVYKLFCVRLELKLDLKIVVLVRPFSNFVLPIVSLLVSIKMARRVSGLIPWDFIGYTSQSFRQLLLTRSRGSDGDEVKKEVVVE